MLMNRRKLLLLFAPFLFALSLFLPLGTYGRVLWVARTGTGRGLPTRILFRGPRQ